MREELEVAAAAPEDTAGTGLADLGPPAPRSPSRPGSPATLAAMMRGAAAIGASSDEQGSQGNIVFFRPGAPTHVKTRVASMPASNVVFVTRFNTPEPAQHPPRAFRAPCAAHAARRARPRPRKPNQHMLKLASRSRSRRRCLSTADSKVQRYARAAL